MSFSSSSKIQRIPNIPWSGENCLVEAQLRLAPAPAPAMDPPAATRTHPVCPRWGGTCFLT